MMRRLGFCCDFCYSSHDNDTTGPEEIFPCEGSNDEPPDACKFVVAPGFCLVDAVLKFIILIAGLVAIGLTISLLDESADDNLKVLRSSPEPREFVNITEIVDKGTVSFIDRFNLVPSTPVNTTLPVIDFNTTVCRVVFRYDSDSSEVLHNFALIDVAAMAVNGSCMCNIESQDLCNPFYDDLFYGFTETLTTDDPDDSDVGFRPYKCFDRSVFIGIDRDNSPRRDRDLTVPCVCPEASIVT